MLVWQLKVNNTMAVLRKTTYKRAFFISGFLHLCFFIGIAVFVSLQSHEPIYDQIVEVEILTEKNEKMLVDSRKFMEGTREKNIEHTGGKTVTEARVSGKPVIGHNGVSGTIATGEGEMSNLATGMVMSRDASPEKMGNQEASVGRSTGERIVQESRISLQEYLARLESLKEYPYMARKRSQEGTVLLRVLFSSGGNVINVGVVQSSGYENLDKAALQLIHRGGTLEHDTGKNIEIEIPVTYSLKG